MVGEEWGRSFVGVGMVEEGWRHDWWKTHGWSVDGWVWGWVD